MQFVFIDMLHFLLCSVSGFASRKKHVMNFPAGKTFFRLSKSKGYAIIIALGYESVALRTVERNGFVYHILSTVTIFDNWIYIWRSRLVWSRARDWKSRNRQKRFKSSNLFFSAKKTTHSVWFFLIIRDSNLHCNYFAMHAALPRLERSRLTLRLRCFC